MTTLPRRAHPAPSVPRTAFLAVAASTQAEIYGLGLMPADSGRIPLGGFCTGAMTR